MYARPLTEMQFWLSHIFINTDGTTRFSISSQLVLSMRCFLLTMMCKHIKHILVIKNTNKNLDWNGNFLRLDFLARFSISSCTSLVALVRIFFHRLRLLTPEGLIFRPLPFWSFVCNTSITTFCRFLLPCSSIASSFSVLIIYITVLDSSRGGRQFFNHISVSWEFLISIHWLDVLFV